MKKLPKNKWLEIYASLKLIKFYEHIHRNERAKLEAARSYFDKFNKEEFNDNEENSFDCIPNGLSFIYLLLVRSSEILERYLENDYEIVKKQIWEYIKKKYGFERFWWAFKAL